MWHARSCFLSHWLQGTGGRGCSEGLQAQCPPGPQECRVGGWEGRTVWEPAMLVRALGREAGGRHRARQGWWVAVGQAPGEGAGGRVRGRVPEAHWFLFT